MNYECLGGGETGNIQAVRKSKFFDLYLVEIKPVIEMAEMVVKNRSSSNSVCSKSTSGTSNVGMTTIFTAGRVDKVPAKMQMPRIAKRI